MKSEKNENKNENIFIRCVWMKRKMRGGDNMGNKNIMY